MIFKDLHVHNDNQADHHSQDTAYDQQVGPFQHDAQRYNDAAHGQGKEELEPVEDREAQHTDGPPLIASE